MQAAAAVALRRALCRRSHVLVAVVGALWALVVWVIPAAAVVAVGSALVVAAAAAVTEQVAVGLQLHRSGVPWPVLVLVAATKLMQATMDWVAAVAAAVAHRAVALALPLAVAVAVVAARHLVVA